MRRLRRWQERLPAPPAGQITAPRLIAGVAAEKARFSRCAFVARPPSFVFRLSSKKRRVYGRNMVPFPGANCAGGPVLFDRLGRRKNRLPAALRRSRGGQITRGPLCGAARRFRRNARDRKGRQALLPHRKTQKQPVRLDELFLNVLRDQFRYTLEIEKNESWGGFELFQLYFFAIDCPWLRTIGSFLRVTEIDVVLHFPSSSILQEPARRPAAYIPVRSGLIRIPLPDDSSFLGRFSGHPPP